MKLPTFRTAILTALCVLVLSATVTTTVSAASIPSLGTKLYYVLGSFLRGGMVSTGSATLDTTSVAGAWDVTPDFATATTLKPVTNALSSGRIYGGKFNAYVRGSTGSTTLRYGAACFPNPFRATTTASGVIARLDYHAGSTNGNGGDIGFVKSCTGHAANDNTASGDTIINNTCTATGCLSSYTTATATFNGLDYIKFTPRAKLGATAGRITFELIKY